METKHASIKVFSNGVRIEGKLVRFQGDSCPVNAIKMVMVRTQPWIGEMVIIGIFGALMFRAGIDKAISESLKASIPYWVGLLMCAVWIDKVYKKGAETEVFIKVGLKKDANTLYARCC